MNDQETIRRCLNGDRDAFRHLVEQYQNEAAGHAVAILGNAADVQEAVQEAFIDAFQALPRFDTSRRFYPWFYALLRNRCFRLLRKRVPTESLDSAVILSGSVEETIALERALLKLAPEDRELILMRGMDGLSYQELSEWLGIPQGTVMSRLFHARRKLRELMEGGERK